LSLAACIASGLGSLVCSATAVAASASAQVHALLETAAVSAAPVLNCADTTASGTLRSSLVTAVTGDVIDLSGLPCNEIQLVNSLPVTAANITIKARPGTTLLSIKGAPTGGRIFNHTVAGTLKVEYISATNGLANDTRGGCIYSVGNVELFHSELYDCVVAPLKNTPNNTLALGGAIYAKGSVTLTASSISAANILNSYGQAFGGAVASATNVVLRADPKIPGSGSAISYSTAKGAASLVEGSSAGAISASGVDIEDSSIFKCSALSVGAVSAAASLTMRNSTISGNHATSQSGKYGVGGVYASGTVDITNSTFADNVGTKYGALLTGPKVTSTVISSIFTGSTKPGSQSIGDFGRNAMYPGTLTGYQNLIANPPTGLTNTISGPALLSPLSDHGGLTPVHLPQSGSAALRAGINVQPFLIFDQRGNPRGRVPNIDIGSVQVTDILFADGFEEIP
jgi:hypothetical protein